MDFPNVIGSFSATIMDDCYKSGLKKCESTQQSELGNTCFWDATAGRDGKLPNACYVKNFEFHGNMAVGHQYRWLPEGNTDEDEHQQWYEDANMEDCRGTYHETGGASGAACTRVKLCHDHSCYHF